MDRSDFLFLLKYLFLVHENVSFTFYFSFFLLFYLCTLLNVIFIILVYIQSAQPGVLLCRDESVHMGFE
jgi:hypothetical protein